MHGHLKGAYIRGKYIIKVSLNVIMWCIFATFLGSGNPTESKAHVKLGIPNYLYTGRYFLTFLASKGGDNDTCERWSTL